jgi:hypothetical protein
MQRRDLHVGDYVTCWSPAGVYYAQACFTGEDVGTVASISAGLPAPIIVDFYSRRIPSGSGSETLWRTCLSQDNVLKVSQDRANEYLKTHAPTWEEHLQSLLASYGNDHYQAVRDRICAPYPMYSAHANLVPFLETYPSQQALKEFLETFRKEFEWTGNRVLTQVSTLVLANKCLDELRVPWTYTFQEHKEIRSSGSV